MKKTSIPVSLNEKGKATLAQALKKVIEEYDINHSHSAGYPMLSLN